MIMACTSRNQRCATGDAEELKVAQFWRESHRTEGTINQYFLWVRRFHIYCRTFGLSEYEQLTRDGVDHFACRYRGPRMLGPAPLRVRCPARKALFAWACALRSLDRTVPQWCLATTPKLLTPMMAEYVTYRKRSRGVSEGTLIRDRQTAEEFLKVVRSRVRTVARARATDIDRFVAGLAGRVSKRTVADTCSSLRAFLRFLCTTGRSDRDLSEFVVAPRVRRIERPPRALPWTDIRSILHTAQRGGPASCRDYAVLLLMASYGMGAAETVSIRIEDIDWSGELLRVRRPKTGVSIVLPLLPVVAKAVAAYIENQRPHHAKARTIFLSVHLPHRPMSTSAVRYLVRKHARKAGVCAELLGGHAFRHSHATRQVNTGANLKIVGDILGHRRPESTSVYVRVALQRLRAVGLPVPR